MKHKIIVIVVIVILAAVVGVSTIYLLGRFAPRDSISSQKNVISKAALQQQAVAIEIEANTAIKNGDWAKATEKLIEAKRLYLQAGDEKSVKRVELRLEPVKNGQPPRPNGISRMEQQDPVVDTLK